MHIHGFKKQKGQAQKPHIAKDDLVSTSYANILYGLAEGEIVGLSDGGKSIKLDGTPLINDNGQPNFTGVNWDFRTGTLDQSHIAGFPAVENETNVGVELRSERPWVKAITNRELSAVRVRLNFNSLREQKDNGDVVGYAIAYAIDVQTDGGSFQEVLTDTARGKASSGYKKSHRIDLPNAGTAKRWTIRVRRITPNRNSDLIADTVHIDALTEIIDAKLAYPCTALLGLSYDAKTFSNIAKLAVRLKGKIIQVPSNYNADTRTYNGLWDGTFKMAYSNNPAWVFYDLCTHKRYGLGERLATMVDKWRLYQIGQYCDEMVDDGKGGKEPRFTVNVYIQKADDAYRVLQNLAGVFRGLSFWDGQNIIVDSDTPKEPVYTFSPANVVGGEFAYTGTRARDRHTLAKVAWDNPDNGFNTEYELIPDEQAIARYGVKVLDIAAFGCTSQGQAQRAGLWALKAEQLETQTVSFKTGLQGFIPQVGQVINIADNVFAGRAVSGKIVAVADNQKTITLDRVAGKVGDMLTVNGATGIQTAKITAVRGQVLTLDKPINAQSEHIWAVISDDLKLKQFRILTIVQNDDATFDITALEHNAQKYAVVDNGAIVTPQPYTVLKATPITAPNSVKLTASTRTVQGQAVTTLTINWEQVQGATAYIVKWRKDDGNWQTLPKVNGQSVDIEGIYAGNYTAQVQAVDSFDNESLATTSQLTNIAGKTGKPPRLTSLTVQGILFGMNLGWAFARGSDDTNFTEIEVSPDGRSNITTLGTFAYPTNKHEITGLQGGLTQFYRGRIVDKLGNVSDWTAWVRGVTENNAEKVLNLISGQINESHLHQSLSTPIAKIGGLETAVNSVNAQLPTLNGQITTLNSKATTLQTELNTAKNTLQTATANITTEKNRITAAIRDITTLQTANNAKTQEIANLMQTVGGHTSSIRELGVTTGNLSQKYTALKTASDTANSEITAIKQIQSGTATSIERLGAKFDNLAVGGRNLLLASGNVVENGEYITKSYRLAPTHNLAHDEKVVITLWGQLSSDKTHFWAYNSGGMVAVGRLDKIADGVYQLVGNWKITTNTNTASNNELRIYAFNRNQTGISRIDRIKLERGNIATDWTPAPEDLQADIDSKASTANLETLRQTLTNADTALSQQITTIDTAYKSADRTLTANLQSEITARTSADNALGQRIDALQTDYNGNKASVANQLKTLSDKDTAMASRVDTLTANYTALDSRTKWTELTATTDLNTLTETGKYFIRASSNPNAPFTHWTYVVVEKARNDRITQTAWADNNASLVYTRVYNGAWQAWEKTATGKELDNKASVASLNEFKQTSANAGTALGERITAIDTAYKQADTATNAKLAQAEKAISDNNTALSQRITALDTAYKSADNNLTARLAREETARASGDNANSQAIRTLESTVNGIGGRVGTSESKIATLERTTSDTNQALATAQNQLSARFDNLAIGGRNLLRNTQNPTATSPIYHATATAPRLDGVTVAYENEVMTVQATKASNRLALAVWSDSRLDLEPNADYVLSGLVKAQSDTELSVRWFKYLNRWISHIVKFNATTEWTKFTVKFSVPNEPITGAFLDLIINVPMDNAVSFKSLKLEKGNIATDWTPAPEDLQAEIDSKASTAMLDEFKQTQSQKDTATASQISQLTANVTTAQQTANTANTKADTATTKADNAQNTANNALNRANTANSAITAEQKARADADSSLASQISSLDTAYKSADSQLSTRITTAQNTATNAQNAVATAQSELKARFDNLKIGGRNLIVGSQVSRTTHGTTNLAISQNIDFGTITHLVLSCDVRFTNAQRATTQGAKWFRIGAEIRLVWADGTSGWYGAWRSNVANGTSFDGRVEHKIIIPTGKTLKAIDNAKIQIWDIMGENMLVKNPKLELGTIATDWTPAPEDLQVDLSPYATNSSLNEFKQAQATKDTTTAQKLSQLESGLGTKANTSALDSLTTKVNQVDGKITAEAQKISTLQTTVNGQTSSIQQHAQSLNGLSAQWTLKVQSGNIVSGIGLASSNGVSDFAVRADKFYIASPTGQKGDTPFTVLTSPQVINGVRVPAGTYIKSAFIQDGSIDIAKINKASIQSLSALSANIGHFKSAKTGARLEIKDGVLLVYDEQNRLRVRLGVW